MTIVCHLRHERKTVGEGRDPNHNGEMWTVLQDEARRDPGTLSVKDRPQDERCLLGQELFVGRPIEGF